MLNKIIKAKSKAAFQSSTSIQKMNACYWKGWRPDKTEENLKFYKKEKAKPADNQPTILAGITTQPSSKNLQRIKENYCNQYLDQIAGGILATGVNLVNIVSNNFSNEQNRHKKDINQIMC